MSDARTDAFLDGRLRLRQPAAGHRVGTDAVLLASETPPTQKGLILDIGAGVGAVGLMAALRGPDATIGLVEIDPESAALARENIASNDLAARIIVHEADVLSAKSRRLAGLIDEKAALVLTNPPFHEAHRVRVTPDPDKARAHVMRAPLDEWIRACLALLAPGGTFVMIHRADALGAALRAMEGRLGGVAVQPVHTRADAPATRILLSGVKGSKAPLALLPAKAVG